MIALLRYCLWSITLTMDRFDHGSATGRIANSQPGLFFYQGWSYAADDSRDGGGRAKQKARAEHKDVRERLCQGWTYAVNDSREADHQKACTKHILLIQINQFTSRKQTWPAADGFTLSQRLQKDTSQESVIIHISLYISVR